LINGGQGPLGRHQPLLAFDDVEQFAQIDAVLTNAARRAPSIASSA
jgi:hypothetical protein